MKQPLIILTGPTAVGKTKLSIALAKAVNGEIIDEPYVKEKIKGECDIDFPFTVPERTVFVLGDNRSTSVDSRNSLIGCISVDEVVGRIVFRVWPFRSFKDK